MRNRILPEKLRAIGIPFAREFRITAIRLEIIVYQICRSYKRYFVIRYSNACGTVLFELCSCRLKPIRQNRCRVDCERAVSRIFAPSIAIVSGYIPPVCSGLIQFSLALRIYIVGFHTTSRRNRRNRVESSRIAKTIDFGSTAHIVVSAEANNEMKQVIIAICRNVPFESRFYG